MGMLTSFLPAFLLSGFVYLDRDHAASDPGDHAHRAGALLRDHSEGLFLKGVGLRILVGELGFLALYAAIVFLLATRKLSQKLA